MAQGVQMMESIKGDTRTRMKTMFNNFLGFVGLAFTFFNLFPLNVQAVNATYQIGIILPDDEWASSIDGLKDGMKSLGYIEGQNIVYEVDNAKGDKKRVLETAKKFVADKVDAIYTVTNTALKIVVDTTRASKTPVVFGSASGPVESGVVQGYATPDGHVTGVTSGSIELVAKRLEILKEVLPQVKRVTAIGDLESDSSKAAFRLAQETAPKVGLTVTELRVRSRDEAVEEVKKLARKNTDAIFLIPGLFSVGAVHGIAAQAKLGRIPFAVYQVEHIKINGTLLSYGSSYYLQGKQSAVLLDKILRGVSPSQLPIERPKNHKLIFNLATAKEIGIKFSPDMLSRADEFVGAAKTR
jgi:putative ABC transport system substrate-binding protein